jgi:hypothetical protein
MGHSGDDYPDRRVLLRILLDNVHRMDADLLDLTATSASALRAAGYTTALGPGAWLSPRLPLDMLSPHPSLAGLARRWYGEGALIPPPAPGPRRHSYLSPQQRIQWALGDIIRSDDTRTLLLSIAGRQSGIGRRRLQQNHRRLGAARFNAALTMLTTREIVKISTLGVVQFVEGVTEALRALETSVRHALWARAKARKRERAGKREVSPSKRARIPRTYRRRQMPSRVLCPHAWGRAMRARKAGLARQRQARASGHNPTLNATQARLRRRSREQLRSPQY